MLISIFIECIKNEVVPKHLLLEAILARLKKHELNASLSDPENIRYSFYALHTYHAHITYVNSLLTMYQYLFSMSMYCTAWFCPFKIKIHSRMNEVISTKFNCTDFWTEKFCISSSADSILISDIDNEFPTWLFNELNEMLGCRSGCIVQHLSMRVILMIKAFFISYQRMEEQTDGSILIFQVNFIEFYPFCNYTEYRQSYNHCIKYWSWKCWRSSLSSSFRVMDERCSM